MQDEFLERCSHALVADGGTWLVDPLDAPVVDELQDVRGVIQLLDRHQRDCAAIAQRLGVPHHVVPEQPIGPFEFLPVRRGRTWKEVALWWPERRVLACGDALGTVGYFRARSERLGVHPFLRLRPPQQLRTLAPRAILCGHGRGLLDAADEALREALSTSRRRIPAQLANAVRSWRARARPER